MRLQLGTVLEMSAVKNEKRVVELSFTLPYGVESFPNIQCLAMNLEKSIGFEDQEDVLKRMTCSLSPVLDDQFNGSSEDFGGN